MVFCVEGRGCDGGCVMMRELGRSKRLFLVFSVGDEGSYLISSDRSMIDLLAMITLQLAELITEYLIYKY